MAEGTQLLRVADEVQSADLAVRHEQRRYRLDRTGHRRQEPDHLLAPLDRPQRRLLDPAAIGESRVFLSSRYAAAMMREAEPDGDPQVADAKVPNRSDSVYAARAFLVRLLDGWGVSDTVIDDAALLTSELMANAVEHGSGDVNLRIEVNDGVLHVAVHDESEELPRPGQADPDSTGGRGLWIVQSVARDWGSDSGDGEPGKTVWFELKASEGADD